MPSECILYFIFLLKPSLYSEFVALSLKNRLFLIGEWGAKIANLIPLIGLGWPSGCGEMIEALTNEKPVSMVLTNNRVA